MQQKSARGPPSWLRAYAGATALFAATNKAPSLLLIESDSKYSAVIFTTVETINHFSPERYETKNIVFDITAVPLRSKTTEHNQTKAH